MLSFSKSALCLLLASPLIAAVIAAGCSDSPTAGTAGSGATQSSSGTAGSGNGVTGGSGGAGGGSSGTGGETTGTGGNWSDGGVPVIVNCTNQVYQCGDTIDNDGDGLIDWQDPDCLGPCDNTENGLNLGIPGGDGPACTVDCYWDSNSGSGDDQCYWNHKCDPLSVDPNFYPEPWNGTKCAYDMNANTPGTNDSCDTLLTQQPATCLKICPSLTPNGCDCFGCCVLYKNGQEYGPVWLGTEDGNGNFTCTLDKLGTADQNKACAPCTPVQDECFNGCGKCELCIGKTVDDLPPECFPQPPPDGGSSSSSASSSGSGSSSSGSPPPQCPTGVQPCGLPGQALCEVGWSCITGCCVQNPK